MATDNTKQTQNQAHSYSAKNLEVLEGLDAVRMRPGMYIGSTGVKGLHHILWEIVDNAIDEAANGYANKITVTLYKDGSASVEDNRARYSHRYSPERKGFGRTGSLHKAARGRQVRTGKLCVFGRTPRRRRFRYQRAFRMAESRSLSEARL